MITINKKIKTLILLIANCLLISASLIISISAFTTAWFVNAKDNNAGSMNISIDALDLQTEFYVYQRDLSSNDYHGTDKDSEGNDLSLSNFKLQTYDSIFEKMNKYTSSIIRVKVFGEDFPRNGNLSLNIYRDIDIQGDLSKLNEYFSSIISFGCVIDSSFYDESIDKGTSVETIFDNVINYFEPSDPALVPTSNIKVFPEEGTEDVKWHKKDELNFNFSYTFDDFDFDNETDKNNEANGYLNLYIYIGYNKDLINSYKNENGLAVKSLNESIVDFNDDIDLFKLNVEGVN